MAAQCNSGVASEAPTAVGFCTYIRRACLTETGLFDEQAFGRGYGEENDFSQRAIEAGWHNLIASDIFVRHWGSASFQGEKNKRIEAAMKVMAKRHPTYLQQVADFIARDPLSAARRRLDWARLERLAKSKNVLLISHNRGGGTERHVQEDVQALNADGYGTFLLRPVPGQPTRVVLSHHQARLLPNLASYELADTDTLCEALGELGITEIHSHSLVDATFDAPTHITRLVQRLGIRWEVNIHDYKIICPRINLADETGRYCGEPDEAGCKRFLALRGSDFGSPDIGKWRKTHAEALTLADRILVPDQDVADRLQRYFPDIAFEVSPHDEIIPPAPAAWPPRLSPGEPMHVVVIGAISRIKGFDVLLACARDAQQRHLPLRFTVMGYSQNDRLLENAGVSVTGRYVESEALSLLQGLKPHAVWLPSLWPETYSYTLSLALQAGYPVFAFDIGAIASRLRSIGHGDAILPLSYMGQPRLINAALAAIDAEVNAKEASG
jgi:glycosyltransferase involved in cell wall biosynthesis